MPDIKLISVDLFRTLVDLEDARDRIWKTFLQERYSPDLAQKCWDRATELLFQNLDEVATGRSPFKKTRTLMEEAYAALFKEIDCTYQPSLAAEALIESHKRNSPYSDARPFLEAIGTRYPICLSTDCDTEMITGIRNLYPFDRLFVSEELGAYKQNPVFFRHVIKHYGLSPNNILHVGDSRSDIITPKQIGIVTCWLNRKGKKWQHSVYPDYEVKSLLDLAGILGPVV
jgi:FMN hydrolase / 5-amino-6-(5-phospho-D-ribitylamino)uracil phosphatase